jgi:hypothetical protein
MSLLTDAPPPPRRPQSCAVGTTRMTQVLFLLLNSRSASLGLNLQGACHKVMVLDMPENVSTFLRIVGRASAGLATRTSMTETPYTRIRHLVSCYKKGKMQYSHLDFPSPEFTVEEVQYHCSTVVAWPLAHDY